MDTMKDTTMQPAKDVVIEELLDRLKAAEKERDELRAKVAEMEQQEPVAWQTRTRPAWNDGTWWPWRKCSEEYAEDIKKTPLLHDWLYEARAIYALPGAQPAPSVPDGSAVQTAARIMNVDLIRQRDALRAEIEELHVLIAAVKKQANAEFCLRVKKEEEYARLRAKIESMEQQKPVGEIVAFGESLHEVSWNRGKLPPLGAKIYALPGAQGEEKWTT